MKTTKQKRMSLLELKDNLNKLDTYFLSETKLMWDNCSDECSGEFSMLTMFSEDDDGAEQKEDLRLNEYEKKAFKDIQKRFIKPLNADLKQAKIRDGEKGYDEEYNYSGEE